MGFNHSPFPQFRPKERSFRQLWPLMWLVEPEPKDIKKRVEVSFRHREGSILVNFDSTQ